MNAPFAATAALPAWWHPLPSDLPRRPEIPSAPDPALLLPAALAEAADMFRISHHVMRGAVR